MEGRGFRGSTAFRPGRPRRPTVLGQTGRFLQLGLSPLLACDLGPQTPRSRGRFAEETRKLAQGWAMCVYCSPSSPSTCPLPTPGQVPAKGDRCSPSGLGRGAGVQSQTRLQAHVLRCFASQDPRSPLGRAQLGGLGWSGGQAGADLVNSWGAGHLSFRRWQSHRRAGTELLPPPGWALRTAPQGLAARPALSSPSPRTQACPTLEKQAPLSWGRHELGRPLRKHRIYTFFETH